MKAKKLILLAVASLTLSGCSIEDLMFWKKKDEPAGGDDSKPAKKYDYEPEITGGDEMDKKAILEALNYKGVCYYGSNEIGFDTPMPVSFDDGKNIDLFKEVKYDSDHVCKLTWSVDSSQDYYKAVINSDATHDYIEINYKFRQSDADPFLEDGELEWVLTKIECNDAVATPNLEFKALVSNTPYYHEKQSIAELYAIDDHERVVEYEGGAKTAKYASTFNICTYDAPEKDASGKYPAYVPAFTRNNQKAIEEGLDEATFRYQEVLAKYFYHAPDGNFGLVRNGKDVLEIYAGSGDGTPLTPEKFPHFKDEYIKIFGTMGQYCGNIQLSFINQISGVTEAEKAQIDGEGEEVYEPLDETRLASLKVSGYTCEKQAVQMDGHGFSNSLREVTGTYVANSLKDKSGDAVAPSAMSNGKGSRYTFKLKVGAQEITVAYDYHTDQIGNVGLFNAMKAKLEAGGSMTVKGTMRYSGYDSEKASEADTNWLRTEGNTGVWTIVPFLGNHVA